MISFHKEEVVHPTADLNLVNFGWETINPNMQNINEFAIQANPSNGVIGKTYQYNAENMVLVDTVSHDPITIPSDINVTGTYREWGASVGPLLTSDRATHYNSSNSWDVEQNEDVYYRWETGKNDWNKFTGIKPTNGDLVSFDAPISFTYEHDASKDINGATDAIGAYSLNYDGFSLQVPWKNENGKWFPKINIKSGTQLTYNGVNYRIKILDEELVLRQATNNDYSGTPPVAQNGNPELVIPNVPTGGYASAENASEGFAHNANLVLGIGEKPLNAQVKVIKGKLVD